MAEKVAMNMTYLDRYMSGEHQQVWDELMQLGPKVCDSEVYMDAFAVARETMRRVRKNIEIIIARLIQTGYVFGYDHLLQTYLRDALDPHTWQYYYEAYIWAKEQPPVFVPSIPHLLGEELFASYYTEELFNDEELRGLFENEELRGFLQKPSGEQEKNTFDMGCYIQEIEQCVGFVPPSIRAWYEEVGGINFYGYHEKWHTLYGHSLTYYDPLMIRPLNREIVVALKQNNPPVQTYEFEFAPDCFVKNNVSGSNSAYRFEFPYKNSDIFLGALRTPRGHAQPMTFVQYLRKSLSWAGFPGMEEWPLTPKDEIDFITADLIPF